MGRLLLVEVLPEDIQSTTDILIALIIDVIAITTSITVVLLIRLIHNLVTLIIIAIFLLQQKTNPRLSGSATFRIRVREPRTSRREGLNIHQYYS